MEKYVFNMFHFVINIIFTVEISTKIISYGFFISK